ncbi:hypothetical protein BGX27_004692 [Mortierella sp. AM989]|nr:hypothetical protein BGX27_004692 [Mortierella sp. AM989]
MNSEPWPVHIERVFARIPLDGVEKLWYPPYCTLLTAVFTFNEGYMLAPQTYPVHNTRSKDLDIEFLIENEEGVPVLGLEIKRASDIELVQARIDADRQVRSRFNTITSPLPRFHIISAIGTRCCVSTYDRNTRAVTPLRIAPTNPSVMEDLAPFERWNIDIATYEGMQALNACFNDVKIMASSL